MLDYSLRRALLSATMRPRILALVLMATSGMAIGKPENISEAEMKLIPRYCPDTMGFKYGDAYYNTSPRAGHWVSLMGKSFWAMHHYCWAQINMNRARKAGVPQQMRKGLWESAVSDYRYVINNSTPDFIMLPEVLTRIGEVELLLAHPDKANEAFAQARQLKPDYWPAYTHWAEFLMHTGRRPEALKIVASGLQHSPDSRVLLELFRVLGGKPDDIPKTPVKPQDVDTSIKADEPAAPPAASSAAEEKSAH